MANTLSGTNIFYLYMRDTLLLNSAPYRQSISKQLFSNVDKVSCPRIQPAVANEAWTQNP